MHDPMVVAFEIKRPWPRRSATRKRANGSTYRFWPALITVWHVEPGGADALTVCKRSGRWQWHIHHWKLQFHSLQRLRRRLLTRCAECGGRSTKTHSVCVSHQWDRDPGPWWRGEQNLYHSDCSLVVSARRKAASKARAATVATRPRMGHIESNDNRVIRPLD